MSYQRIQRMRADRAGVAERARMILDRARQAGRDLTPDEAARFDRMHAEIESSGAEIARLEQAADDVAAAHSGPIGRRGGDSRRFNDALRRWALKGPAALTDGDRQLLAPGRSGGQEYVDIVPSAEDLRAVAAQEKRMSTTFGQGGDLVPEGFWPEIQHALLTAGSARQAARIIRTSTGNPMPVPTIDDTSNIGVFLAEEEAVPDLNVSTGRRVMKAYKYSSGFVKVSAELIEDSAFSLESEIAMIGGERIARITEAHYATGTGVDQPQGVVTASAQGHEAAAAAAVSFADVLDLKHSVDPAYRMGPNSGFMLNDSTLSSLKKLAIGASDSRPLWQSGVALREPDTIDGSRYWVNQAMPDIATGNRSMLFGDFSRFMIRDVANLRIVRLVERFIDNDQQAFVLFMRTDSALTTAGAVKHLVHP